MVKNTSGNKKKNFSISIIGAGNVATHIARAFYHSKVEIRTITSRTIEHATLLADMVSAKVLDDIQKIPNDVDFIIISTTDSTVLEIVEKLPQTNAIILHTSGSVPLDGVLIHQKKCGVLYPLQTFSKDIDVDVENVPFFTEGSDEDTLNRIDELAKLISKNIYHADSNKRKSLHIAGVLTSNFPIYLLGIAERVLESAGYPLEVVKPLLDVTIDKAFKIGPHNALTGPARRGDIDVVKLHQSQLSGYDAEIYKVISDAILKEYHK